ncbi:MAG: DUF2971 domain-containing protein [Victivallales bacterium]
MENINSKRFLYRYYCKGDYIFDVLRNKRLYFCLPTEFKDPFDCRPLTSISHNRVDNETWNRFLYCLAKFQYSKKTESEIKKHANAAFAKKLHRNHLWLRETDNYLMKRKSPIRVCCFTKSPRNMVMWEHYANNHKGVVFQFRKSSLNDAVTGQFRGQEVRYIPGALGVKDYLDSLEKGIQGDALAMAHMIYSTKSREWVYEDEVRFFTKQTRHYVSFDKESLSGIILGAKCSVNFRKTVRQAISRWEIKPRLYQASIEKSTHKLWINSFI